MKKSITLFLFLFFVYLCLLAAKASGQPVNTEQVCNQTVASGRSFADQVGDWWATLGKSADEKAKILEERAQQANTTTALIKDTKEKAGAQVNTLTEQARQKAQEIKSGAGNQTVQLKEKAKIKLDEAKAKASTHVESCKQSVKQETDKMLDDAKGFFQNLLK